MWNGSLFGLGCRNRHNRTGLQIQDCPQPAVLFYSLYFGPNKRLVHTHILGIGSQSHRAIHTQCHLTRSVAHIVRCSSATASFRYKCLYTVSPVCCHTVQGIQKMSSSKHNFNQQACRLLVSPFWLLITGNLRSSKLGLDICVLRRLTARSKIQNYPLMILPQVHLRKPCYDFYFL